MILFLDYDGVLHPDAAYLIKGRPVLKCKGGELFMWAPMLIEALAPHPNVQIVLSTSWARQFGFYRARKWLPAELQSRVIGATWHSQMGKHQEAEHRLGSTWWDEVDRYQQIRRYVIRAGLGSNWLAIDDQPGDWDERHMDNLVLVNGDDGLCGPFIVERLAELLCRGSEAYEEEACRDSRQVRFEQNGG